MAITWQTTKPSWKPLVEAPQEAPSIVLVVLDDTGFAHLARVTLFFHPAIVPKILKK